MLGFRITDVVRFLLCSYLAARFPLVFSVSLPVIVFGVGLAIIIVPAAVLIAWVLAAWCGNERALAAVDVARVAPGYARAVRVLYDATFRVSFETIGAAIADSAHAIRATLSSAVATATSALNTHAIATNIRWVLAVHKHEFHLFSRNVLNHSNSSGIE